MRAFGAVGLPRRRLRWPQRAIIVFIFLAGSVALAGATLADAATTVVQVGRQNGGTLAASQFDAASQPVSMGDTVHWEWYASTVFGHTVTSYSQTGGVADWQTPAPLNGPGQSFDHAFPAAGVFTYYCSIHALRTDADPATIDASIAAGKMVGKIIVLTPSSVGGVAQQPSLPASAAGHGRLPGSAGEAALAVLAAFVGATWYVARRRP